MASLTIALTMPNNQPTATATKTKTVSAIKLGVATLGLALSLNFAAALLPVEGYDTTESSPTTESTSYSGDVSTTDYVATDSATTAEPSTTESITIQPNATTSSTETTSTDFTGDNTVSDTQYPASESYVAPATDYSFSDWVGAIGERIYDYATYNLDASINLLTDDSQIVDTQIIGTVEERMKTLTTLDGEIQRINALISEITPLGAYDDIVQLETARKEYQYHYDTITAVDNDKLYGALHNYSHAIHDLSYNVGGIAVKLELPEKFATFDQKLTQLKNSDSLNQYSQLEPFYTAVKEQNIKLQMLSPKERYDTGFTAIRSFVATNKYYFDLLSPVMENGLTGESQSLIDARQVAFDISVGVDAYYNDKVGDVIAEIGDILPADDLFEVGDVNEIPPITCNDFDRDGFFQEGCVPEGTPNDCNDNNANINPNALERCNGVDDNCNLAIDIDTEDMFCTKTTGVHKTLIIVIEDWILEINPNADLNKVKTMIEKTQFDTTKAMKEMSYGKLNMVFDVCLINKGTNVKMPKDIYEQERSAIKLCEPEVNFGDYSSFVIYPAIFEFRGGAGIVAFRSHKHKALLNMCTVIISETPEGLINENRLENGVVNILSHELGHCLQLAHAAAYYCGYNTYGPLCSVGGYGNLFDFMSTVPYNFYDNQGKTVFPHYNCVFKEKLGWLKSTRIDDRHDTYEIGVLEAPSQLPQCLVLDVDQKYIFPNKDNIPMKCDKLYMEYRKQRRTIFGNLIIDGGIAVQCMQDHKEINILKIYIDQYSLLIDCTPITADNLGNRRVQQFSFDPNICRTNLGYDIIFKATDDFSGKVTIIKTNPSYHCVDQDNDGYQIPNVPQGCTMVEQKVDCNDNEWKVSPGRMEECGDKIDNNCDGKIDEGC